MHILAYVVLDRTSPENVASLLLPYDCTNPSATDPRTDGWQAGGATATGVFNGFGYLGGISALGADFPSPLPADLLPSAVVTSVDGWSSEDDFRSAKQWARHVEQLLGAYRTERYLVVAVDCHVGMPARVERKLAKHGIKVLHADLGGKPPRRPAAKSRKREKRAP